MEHARPYHLRAVVGLALSAALCAALGLHALQRWPGLAWLEADASAPWIEYPLPPRLEARPALRLETEFARDFELGAVPARAELRARGFRELELWINGQRILPQADATTMAATPDAADWKRWQRTEVARVLRPGANRVVARVANATGPPALALALRGEGLELASGPEWSAALAGASERAARLAGTRARPASELAPEAGGRAVASLRASRGWLLGAGLAALAFAGGVSVLAARAGARRWLARPEPAWLLAAGVWIALFAHAARLLPLELGFDARGHLDYLRYLQEQQTLPVGHMGWQMYQPPLFYVAAASWLGLAGLQLESARAAGWLRTLQLGFGLLQLALIYTGVRRLLPGRAAAPALALLFAAALPMQTTLFQLIGNETLAMPLVSLTTLLALAAFQRGNAGAARWAGVGAALGLALLAKFSAALLLPPLLVTLLLRGALASAAPRAALRDAAALLAAAAAVCGWHYARVAWLYGTPFAANWDPALGFVWWQDPGYRVAADYRGGLVSAIADPWWAAFTSVPGGFYASFFGDGLLCGERALVFAAPWNYRLLACASALALAPFALIALGALRALRRARREPAWLFLCLLAATTALALLAMPLRVPSYSLVKAHFGHAALLPTCAFLALACEPWLRRRATALALATLLGLWAAASLGGVWIPEQAGLTAAVQGYHALSQRDPARALSAFETALAREPADARFAAGKLEALRALRRGSAGLPLCDAPMGELGASDLRFACARIFEASGNPRRAEQELLRARTLAPDDPRVASALSLLLLREQRGAEADRMLREWLRIRPHLLEPHLELAQLASAAGAAERAAAHLEIALALDPGNRRARKLRATLRAANPDPPR